MPLLVLLIAIALLVLLITWAKLNAFIAFLIVCFLVGITQGLSVVATSASIQKGLGDILGSLVVIIGLGAMLGKLVAESGAASRIATGLISAFGKRYIQWALLLTGFIIGVPLFYGVGFVLLVPLIITVASKYKIPVLYIAIPTLASLSVTHGYLPPHPSPVALVGQFKADIGLTLLYGFIVSIPAIILAGPVFALTAKKYIVHPPDVFMPEEVPADKMPGMFTSLFAAFLPVLLIASASLVKVVWPQHNIITNFIETIGEPSVAMLISVLVAVYTLGISKGRSMKEVMNTLSDAVKDIVMILLIIGGAGALKQVLADTGISNNIVTNLNGLHVHPLLLAWSISAFIRVCIGSATVAGLTTAGIVAPLIATTGVDPNLMVLATGAGSLMFSHVNDTGFWMFKEYFNLSFKQTIKTWSLMETIVSIAGLGGVFVINYFISK